ncbi:alpha-L-rhamnosidase [Kutzneria buriramensis]|uniref:Alpha-L-rhamnosidase n=1 Tax=Kutzneria buriramensis TaxID=1045776 RepID=A0A3E0G823_9PSEU|nr:alpha-L-rhamnosidase [Kutzneria buriramensis]
MVTDGTVNPGEMIPVNHHTLDAITQWLHTTVAGLTAAAPSYGSSSSAPGLAAEWPGPKRPTSLPIGN